MSGSNLHSTEQQKSLQPSHLDTAVVRYRSNPDSDLRAAKATEGSTTLQEQSVMQRTTLSKTAIMNMLQDSSAKVGFHQEDLSVMFGRTLPKEANQEAENQWLE